MMQYQASALETFDMIALRIYGDERFSALLLEANPEYTDRIMMQGGELLKAPEISSEERHKSSLPPWKRGA